jgi:hypothetical protein
MNTISIKDHGSFKLISDFWNGYNNLIVIEDCPLTQSHLPIACEIYLDETCLKKGMIVKKIDNEVEHQMLNSGMFEVIGK